jgi:nicotinate-nucleotide adenylyltransferase
VSTAAVFGGNFDPVHNGHLITALRVYEQRDLEKIIFVPAGISPFKTGSKITDASHRISMLNEAIKEISFFEYNDIEIRTGGVSYTVDTLRKIRNEFDNLELIIGYDNLLDFPKWKEPDEIVKMVKLIVLGRVHNNAETKNRFFKDAVFPDTPVIEISSTDIRDRVKNNRPIDFLVPEKVKEYIYLNNLYKE